MQLNFIYNTDLVFLADICGQRKNSFDLFVSQPVCRELLTESLQLPGCGCLPGDVCCLSELSAVSAVMETRPSCGKGAPASELH